MSRETSALGQADRDVHRRWSRIRSLAEAATGKADRQRDQGGERRDENRVAEEIETVGRAERPHVVVESQAVVAHRIGAKLADRSQF